MGENDKYGIGDIFDEFKAYSEVDAHSQYSISESWSHLSAGESRDFGFVQKAKIEISDAQKRKQEKEAIEFRAKAPKIYTERKQHKNGPKSAKLNEEKVSAIKFLLLKETQTKIAKKFGVSVATISQINMNMSWRHVKPLSSLESYIEPKKERKLHKKRARVNVWGDVAYIPNSEGGFTKITDDSVMGKMQLSEDNFTPYREAVDEFLPDSVFQYIYLSGKVIGKFHSIYERLFCKGKSAERAAGIISRIFLSDSTNRFA